MLNAFLDLPWTWLGIRATGLVAWSLLTCVVVWGLLLRTRLLGDKASPKALFMMHRWLGALALTFLVVHFGLLLIDPVMTFTVTQVFVPFTSAWEPIAVGLGTLAMWALLPVTVLGRLRAKLGKAGATLFKRSHLLAYIAWPLATMHYVLAGTDALAEWSLALLISATVFIVLLLLARGFVPVRRPAVAR
jgi:sulfoxide reductase heme-binding subunit YedZ